MAAVLMSAASRRLMPLAVRAPVVSTFNQNAITSRGVAYKAPVDDVNFVLDDVLDVHGHYQRLGVDCPPDIVEGVVTECAKMAESMLAPSYEEGDKGCVFKDGNVTTPKGFKEAYTEYVAGGWQGLSVPEEYGGQNLPLSLGLIKAEMFGTANWAWGMFPGLAIGCINTLLLHGSEEMKQTYVTKLAEGTWLGTMCLTEPHCGTDLNQVKTKAIPQKDGTYKLKGTKIWISCGEHDFTENIIHIVLARIEGAPEGMKGVSLFLVPKHLIKEDGSLEKKKNIECIGIENKMGIHGSPTCTMAFDETVGYRIGNENEGIRMMFTFMNTARVGTALQGIGAAELAYQLSVPFTQDRRALRSLTGIKEPNQPADAIIHHPDVRKNLLFARSIAEGGRAFALDVACTSDYMLYGSEEDKVRSDKKMDILTPILKGFLTELGTESAIVAQQTWGGSGYIKENRVEQIVRDARIGTIYEGTTGIQSLDLLGRKILQNKGKIFLPFAMGLVKERFDDLWKNRETTQHKSQSLTMIGYTTRWTSLAGTIMAMALRNPDAAGSASVDFLMYSGYVMLGHYWLRMMNVASAKLAADPHGEKAKFYRNKIQTGEFYFDRVLPRAKGHAAMCTKNPRSIMQMKNEDF